MSDEPLADIELFGGKFWFTDYADGRGTLQGPFQTKREAEIAKKQWSVRDEVSQ